MSNFSLHHDAFGRLVLTDGTGVEHPGVTAVRAFPLTDPEHWVSICDPQGKELIAIQNAAELPESTRQTLEADLALREFLPVIERILHVTGDTEPYDWDVETDHGRTRFTLKSEDDVHRLGPYRALIVDAQGVRYLADDYRRLDAYSRRVLEQYL